MVNPSPLEGEGQVAAFGDQGEGSWGQRPLTLARKGAPVPLPQGEREAPHVLGILNLTPDSFSDGGRFASLDYAVAAAHAMIAAGAAMVDIGGESTRPGATFVSEAEELARVGPVLDALGGAVPFSIDTRRAVVMRRALDAGAAMVNDVSALTHDPAALALIAERRCTVVLMHMQGAPQSMQAAPAYVDVVAEVHDWLARRIDVCVAGGIDPGKIVIDPGIGFGKTLDHNLALLRGLSRFATLAPVMLGASRKALIGKLSGAEVADRLPGSLALALHGAAGGCAWVRVHDVPETVQALRVWQAVRA